MKWVKAWSWTEIFMFTKKLIFYNFNHVYSLLYPNFFILLAFVTIFSWWIWRPVSSVDSGEVWIISSWFSTEEAVPVFSTAIQSQILIITGKDFVWSLLFLGLCFCIGYGFIFPLWCLMLSFSPYSYLLIWNCFCYCFMLGFKTWLVLNFCFSEDYN